MTYRNKKQKPNDKEINKSQTTSNNQKQTQKNQWTSQEEQCWRKMTLNLNYIPILSINLRIDINQKWE